jgi:regulator of sirC expression with transglutaminase-like and TPR domain
MSLETPAQFLERIGKVGSGPRDIATAALMLAAMDHPETDLRPYTEHLLEIAEAAKAEAAFARSPELAARGLSDLLQGRYGYAGDQVRYESPDNADMISVIVNRRGLPVALGILYIHAARAAGIKAFGLSAPNHFLLMIQAGGGEAVIDPFSGGKMIEHERSAKPPAITEPPPTGRKQTVKPIGDIEVLLRLQNNIKARALEANDQERAIEVLKRMLLLAPGEAPLWLELGKLQEAAQALGAASEAYARSLQIDRGAANAANEAGLALQLLKRRLN